MCCFIIKTHNAFRWLVLFDYRWFDKIYNKIKYVKKMLLQIVLIIIRIDSHDSLLIEKILTFYVIKLIKSVVNKDKNEYYCNVFIVFMYL